MFFTSSADFNERVSIKAAEFCEQIISEMGAELHDEVIQKLSSMSFYIERIERSSDDPNEIINLVARMRSDFESVTQSVRAISQRLNPVHTNGDSFSNAVAHLCDSMQHHGNGHITCKTLGDEQPISQHTFTYLYRIVQELINNAFKHSAAWKIDVTITWSQPLLIIEVEDDGTRIMKMNDITSTLQSRRNTLQMRSQAINATLRYETGKKGLLVKVELPLVEISR